MLRAGEGKPKIVFLTTDETTEELARLLRQRMPAWIIEHLRTPARIATPELTARLVLAHADLDEDLAAYLSRCRQRFPNAHLGLLVGARLPGECMAFLQSGVIQGLVPLNHNAEVQFAVLNVLLAGGEYCPPALVMRVLQAPLIQIGEPEDVPDYISQGLTPREAQIMALVAKGLQNKLIAAQMDLSEHTVKAHVRNLFTKLKVSNRTQAVAKCRNRMKETRRSGPNGQGGGASAEMHLSLR